MHAKGDNSNLLLELSGDATNKIVLDIATGSGHTALAFAKAGASVAATDLTPGMLETAKTFILSQGIDTVTFREASAEALPFEPQSFDIVTCRIAVHHFADPKRCVLEVARVLKPQGLFLLIDNSSPADASRAETMNYIETIRDPSHVWAYSVSTWSNWLLVAGLEPQYRTRFKRMKNFHQWVMNAQTPQQVIGELEHYILALLKEQQDYFDVVVNNGRLETLSHEVIVIAATFTRG
ncbi:MAG: class I SAM-dependent methyltransferase [Trueperaceae bacterium]